jgi:RNA polymerase sigma-70 factor (ECF subfamily)
VSFHEPEFEYLFVTHYEHLVRSLTAMTGDAETARDCVQEAFVKAAARWRKVRRYEDPVGWVRRVAINRSRDLHRSNQRRLKRESRVANDPLTPGDHDGAMDSVDGSMRLVALLRTLPSRQRAAASLYYVEDLSVEEIARALDISAGAVKFHLSKARETLRLAVEQEEQARG